jgi:hypothetical protein
MAATFDSILAEMAEKVVLRIADMLLAEDYERCGICFLGRTTDGSSLYEAKLAIMRTEYIDDEPDAPILVEFSIRFEDSIEELRDPSDPTVDAFSYDNSVYNLEGLLAFIVDRVPETYILARPMYSRCFGELKIAGIPVCHHNFLWCDTCANSVHGEEDKSPFALVVNTFRTAWDWGVGIPAGVPTLDFYLGQLLEMETALGGHPEAIEWIQPALCFFLGTKESTDFDSARFCVNGQMVPILACLPGHPLARLAIIRKTRFAFQTLATSSHQDNLSWYRTPYVPKLPRAAFHVIAAVLGRTLVVHVKNPPAVFRVRPFGGAFLEWPIQPHSLTELPLYVGL